MRSSLLPVFALVGLAIAVVAMTLLHIRQAGLDPVQQPVSYYIHGASGWLLNLALVALGGSSIALAWALGTSQTTRAGMWLSAFGLGMIIDALARSDRFFPWEQTPSAAGVIHAALALIAPPLLLFPMVRLVRGERPSWRQHAKIVAAIAYAVGLLASGVSLATGFLQDGPPPLIGLAERELALSAVVWLAMLALDLLPTREMKSPSGPN